MLKFNNKVMKFGNYWGTSGSVTPPGPVFDEVTIGTQTWMAKNLNIDDEQGGIYTQTVNYGQGDVVEYYYSWYAAIRLASSIPGWHLPSDTEWNTLLSTVGGSSNAGTKLKSTYGWSSGNGTDDFDFAVFPAGFFSINSFYSLGNSTSFWSNTEYSSDKANYFYFKYNLSSVTKYKNDKSSYNYPVRLIKDAT